MDSATPFPMNAASAMPDSPDAAPVLATVPARLFFIESAACPESGKPGEYPDIAALAIEATSPFPEEKLAVSHAHVAGSGRMTVFAALKERLAATPHANDARHVIPEAALPVPGNDNAWVWILTTDALTAIRRENGVTIAARGFETPGSDDVVSARTLHATKENLPDSGPVWRLERTTFSAKPAGVTFHWRDLGGGGTAGTFATTDYLDGADVRERVVVEALRSGDRAKRLFRPVFRGLVALFALLSLGQAGVWGADRLAARREAALDARRPDAEAVEAKAAMLDTLAGVTTRRTPQLEWLAALNESRPDAVWFTRVASDGKSVVASGRAASMESLNGWLAALKRSGDFSEIATPTIRSSGKTVVFELRAVPAKNAGKKERA